MPRALHCRSVSFSVLWYFNVVQFWKNVASGYKRSWNPAPRGSDSLGHNPRCTGVLAINRREGGHPGPQDLDVTFRSVSTPWVLGPEQGPHKTPSVRHNTARKALHLISQPLNVSLGNAFILQLASADAGELTNLRVQSGNNTPLGRLHSRHGERLEPCPVTWKHVEQREN